MGVQVKCPSCHRGVLLYVGMGEYHCNDVICLHGVDDISYRELELVAYAATVAAKDARIAELERERDWYCDTYGSLLRRWDEGASELLRGGGDLPEELYEVSVDTIVKLRPRVNKAVDAALTDAQQQQQVGEEGSQ